MPKARHSRTLVRITKIERADPSAISIEFTSLSTDQKAIDRWLLNDQPLPNQHRLFPDDLQEGDEMILRLRCPPPDSSST